MKKAMWIARVNVSDTEAYKLYAAAAREAIESFRGKYIVRGGTFKTLEGKEYERQVVIEFESLEKAEACYFSEAYQKARKFREGKADFLACIVECC